MARKKKSVEGGGNWMDTYGDMVTLLLCFFVLLYSMSSVDSAKWEMLVTSFNPNALEVSQVVETNAQAVPGEDPVQGSFKSQPEDIEQFEQMYEKLEAVIKENNLESDVEVVAGEGFTFVTFRNNIFFDGDSYVLRQDGKNALDKFANAIYPSRDSIGQMQILGHTSQAKATEPNEIVSDRYLSSNRATEVLIYLQRKNFIPPAKLVSTGFGQFHPISPVDTRESRAKNRRVEILITKSDAVVRNLEEYYKEVYQDDYPVVQ